jgi:thiamine kinase-like enzyme
MENISVEQMALEKCQTVLPSWRSHSVDDFDFDPPKGFSSFTMGIRARRPAEDGIEPSAVLYRHLEGKENAILDFSTEQAVFARLGQHRIAAPCHLMDDTCRIEEFFVGRTLTANDVFDPAIHKGIADELWRLHDLEPDGLPDETFFDLLHTKWGAMARSVLNDRRHEFPADEQALCDELAAIHAESTIEKVRRCLPDRPPVFCHNDTYHGNVMQLTDDTIKLLDFEFSCRNHIAFDFANLFAETVMEHGFADPPHFRIGEPRFTDADLASLIGFYLDNGRFADSRTKATEQARLVAETRRAIMLSDYMYAMAALPLALEPIQRIRFLPYAQQRFNKFLRTWDAEFRGR